jgi:hypothetical protein
MAISAAISRIPVKPFKNLTFVGIILPFKNLTLLAALGGRFFRA